MMKAIRFPFDAGPGPSEGAFMTDHPMRRSDRALSPDEALAVLDDAAFVTLSTVDEEGHPYGVPLSFVRRESTLYVHATNQNGLKFDCFRHDERACATAVTDVVPFFANGDFSTYYRSAMAFGLMREVEPGVEFKRALVDLCTKYVPEAKAHIGEAMRCEGPNTSVWALDIRRVTGKAQPLPPSSAALASPNTGQAR